ncbi:MAG: ImmA/IrrE family metallo-endopeptidase [Spirochaetia bacterium]|nr:ImmA/IrrE family metallo-endopeptidase [Spirochaetia bacterium]
MCIKNENSSLIAINSQMSEGRQRFSLAHELFHYYYDKETPSIICKKIIDSKDIREQEADRFASFLLIPQTSLAQSIESIKGGEERALTTEEIIKLEQKYRVSRQALLYRLQKDKELLHLKARNLQHNVILSAATLGYDVSLYKPSAVNEQKVTYGYYIKKAEELLEAKKISIGKYEELLIDAFREDIVFGTTQEDGEHID